MQRTEKTCYFLRSRQRAERFLGLHGVRCPKLIHGSSDPRDDLAASALEAEVFHCVDEEFLISAEERVGADPANDFDQFAVRVGVDRLVAPDVRPLCAARVGTVFPARTWFD